jgi:hypothetical protein
VIEDCSKAFYERESPPPVYFYCSRNPAEPGRSNTEHIMASLARQLSSLQPGEGLLDPVIATYKQRETEAFASGPLRLDETSKLVMQLLENYPMVTVIIDALDECDPHSRVDLLEILENILQDSSSLIKIFVSSRDDQDIVFSLRQYPNLNISSERNFDDIVAFVNFETQRLVKKRALLQYSSNKEDLQQMVIDRVIDGANGM